MRKILLSISFLALAAGVFAGTGKKEKTISPEQQLEASIQRQVSFPHFLLDNLGSHSATVRFTINPDGSIHVRDIVSDEADLTENLLNQIGSFSVNTRGLSMTDTYKIVLRFNTL